ncbi:peptidase M24 [Cyathus striatus]|nr:peptidase M24 [Cyathus striatus]
MSSDMKYIHLPSGNEGHEWNTRKTPRLVLIIIILGLAIITAILPLLYSSPQYVTAEFAEIASHCSDVPPIDLIEYSSRQTKLASSLRHLGATAYVAEPGATTQYYGGFSNTNWRLTERPLLLIIASDENARPNITILTPKFETTRAKMLPVQTNLTVNYIEWPEEGDPYSTAISSMSGLPGTIFVDSAIRKFIADGLQMASPSSKVVSSPLEINQIRERKSSAEIQILKCANEATLLAIRAVHEKLFLGIRESRARAMMSTALTTAGLKDGGCLTLFGENAALPHGSGTDRSLTRLDFALFDCTASLHGYYSDVTRTVALYESTIPKDHLDIWYSVQKAQTVAIKNASAHVVTGEVDRAARSFLEAEGYGDYFTHRLGHGIGLEVHEEPYLRGGSVDIIKVGHTFSNEPGIYIEGKVGVRLEDCFYINSKGEAIYLTEDVGGTSKSPTKP